MKIKTAGLTGPALDWAVHKAKGRDIKLHMFWEYRTHNNMLHYSTDWSQGGPILESEEIGIRRNAPCSTGREWEAFGSITAKGAGYRWGYGPTPLVAAMRCYVASRLGEEVEIPDELIV